MKFTKILIILTVICFFFYPANLVSQINWSRVESSIFNIYFTRSDKNIVGKFSALIEAEYEILTAQINVKFTKTVHIFLSPSEQVFHELTGNFIPDWGEGVADAAQSLIVLKSPNFSKNPARFAKVVRHELIHVLVGQSLDPSQNIPKWFSEGVAIYFSYDEYFSGGKAISKALFSHSIIPLDEIDELLNFQSAQASLAYEQSYSVILYLEDKYGFASIVQIVQELKQGKTFKQTVLDVYGEDLYDIEYNWYAYIEKKYRWRFLLDFETFLWIFILLLFIFVFVAIRIRNRRTVKRWEDEDAGLADF